MVYKNVKEIMKNAPTNKFVILLEDGTRVTKRLFVTFDGICEYLPHSKQYGRRVDYDKWVSLTPIMPTEDFVKVKNFLVNVVKYLSASGLWADIKNDYEKILAQGDDYLKHVLTLDYTEQRKHLYDTIQVSSFHVDSIIYSARKGIVCINYESNEKDYRRGEVKRHIANGTPYRYRWRKGYDNSIEYQKHNDIVCGWYSTEYKDCGNGHYYLALDEMHAIYAEKD